MTIRQTLTSSFLLECLEAIHDLSADTLKLALYDDTALLDYRTTAYSSSHEVTGTGYSAGGFTLSKTAGYPQLSAAYVPMMDFADFTVNPCSLTAYQGLIYNSSKANRSIAVIDLGTLVVTSNLSWVWPPPADDTAVIRLRSAH